VSSIHKLAFSENFKQSDVMDIYLYDSYQRQKSNKKNTFSPFNHCCAL